MRNVFIFLKRSTPSFWFFYLISKRSIVITTFTLFILILFFVFWAPFGKRNISNLKVTSLLVKAKQSKRKDPLCITANGNISYLKLSMMLLEKNWTINLLIRCTLPLRWFWNSRRHQRKQTEQLFILSFFAPSNPFDNLKAHFMNFGIISHHDKIILYFVK